MSPVEFLAALKWNLGLPFRDSPYFCPDCGAEADAYGVHAVTCLRSGFITRGHTSLRDAVQDIYTKAGVGVLSEQRLPGREEKPADLLHPNWRGRPTAIDFTIITPVAASALNRLPSSSSTTLMDQAAQAKNRKSLALCNAIGWNFQPFVADSFGALKSDARNMVSRLINRHHERFSPLTQEEAGRAIWSTITSAIMARVAMQLGRLTILDKPFDMPVQGLNHLTNRLPTSILPMTNTSSSTTNQLLNMGTERLSLPQPSSEIGSMEDEVPSEMEMDEIQAERAGGLLVTFVEQNHNTDHRHLTTCMVGLLQAEALASPRNGT